MAERGEGLEKYQLGHFSDSELDPRPIERKKLEQANRRLRHARIGKEGLRRNEDGSFEIDPYARPSSDVVSEKPKQKRTS